MWQLLNYSNVVFFITNEMTSLNEEGLTSTEYRRYLFTKFPTSKKKKIYDQYTVWYNYFKPYRFIDMMWCWMVCVCVCVWVHGNFHHPLFSIHVSLISKSNPIKKKLCQHFKKSAAILIYISFLVNELHLLLSKYYKSTVNL